MKIEHVAVAIAVYLTLHWMIANEEVPDWLLPLAKLIETKELTAVVAAI